MTKILALLTALILVISDQYIKMWAISNLITNGNIEIIPNLFYLTYVENRGAAFGILQGKTLLLSAIVIAVLSVALWFIISNKIESKFLIWAVSLVIAGGAGNLVDRIYRGFVVDYLDFSSILGFPVFNLADCCVVLGTFMIMIYMIFLDKSNTSKSEKDIKIKEI